MDGAAAFGLFLLAAVPIAIVFFFLRQRAKGQEQLLGVLQNHLQELRENERAQAQNLQTLQQTLSDRLLETTQKLTESLETQLHRVRLELDQKLAEQQRSVQSLQGEVGQRLDTASRLVREVSGQLVKLEEGHQRIYEVGKDIASLQELLRAPKLRGGFGEFLLQELLEQMLPRDRFALQYAFADGQKVDAAVFLGERIVPVDAKFPMENFRRLQSVSEENEKRRLRREFLRDVERHVEDIARKYIRPGENTYDFAFMYIPAENVYYELILKEGEENFLKKAWGHRVVPVSPNSFYAYLQMVLLGLRGMQWSEKSREILSRLGNLAGALERFREIWDKVGKQLQFSRNNYEEAARELARLEAEVQSLSRLEAGDSPENQRVLE